ncbi:hypothetical protein OX284_006155 [Flavobacterium sp. SUN046]|uniref:hypothetical protein n=1 Tax=Flavobacterium sp. SUN046 TaxID=3002440 RepID=UPI002DB87850|nr:hypothetical protein [Flavobacterium sp. SUN046]MEC4049003.1 hypothetical protein [Flavobacterium sp. SUN046]
MKLKKGLVILFISLICSYLYLDNKTYYYGFGYGIISTKIPNRFEIFRADSFNENIGFYLIERDLNLYIIFDNKMIHIKNQNEGIVPKKFIGYWYNNKVLLVKIIDNKGVIRYLEIYEELTNRLSPHIIIEELKNISYDNQINVIYSGSYTNLHYINLNFDNDFFVKLKLYKFLNLVAIIVGIIYFGYYLIIENRQKNIN